MVESTIRKSQKILWAGILLIFIGVGISFLKEGFDSIQIKKTISFAGSFIFIVGFILGIVGMVKHWKAFFQSNK